MALLRGGVVAAQGTGGEGILWQMSSVSSFRSDSKATAFRALAMITAMHWHLLFECVVAIYRQ